AGSAASGLRVVSSPIGSVVADGAGQTLYTYTDDRPGRSACTADWCVQDWPPLIVRDPLPRSLGVSAHVGVLKRPDGTLQATLDGHPLYRFAGDTEPGGVRGLGIGGDWYPIAPNDAKVMH